MASWESDSMRELSRRAEVFFLGFRSDTYSLERAGWQIAAEEDIQFSRVRLLLQNKNLKLAGISAFSNYNYRLQPHDRPPVFNIEYLSDNLKISLINTATFDFKEIDARPRFISSTLNSIDDFKIFATRETIVEDIIVEPMDISRMLAEIKAMQSPEQQAIRQRNKVRDYEQEGVQQVIHAQIITLDNYRKAA